MVEILGYLFSFLVASVIMFTNGYAIGVTVAVKRVMAVCMLFIMLFMSSCVTVIASDDVMTVEIDVDGVEVFAEEYAVLNDEPEDRPQVVRGFNDSGYVGLKIGSLCNAYNATLGAFEIVYKVDAYFDDSQVYSNVFGCEVSGAFEWYDIDTCVELPVGSKVVVSMLYPGSSYVLEPGYESTVVFDDTISYDTLAANFVVTYAGSNRSGSGLVNNFRMSANALGNLASDVVMPDTGGNGIVWIVVIGCMTFVCGLLIVRRNRKAVQFFVLGVGVFACVFVSTVTGYSVGGGSSTIRLGSRVELCEYVEGFDKFAGVANVGKTDDMFVRMRAYCPDGYSCLMESDTSFDSVSSLADSEYSHVDGSWDAGTDDDWYYFDEILCPTSVTSDLVIHVRDEDGDDIVEESYEQDFNVVVLCECVPVCYDFDEDTGECYTYADWDLVYGDYGAS